MSTPAEFLARDCTFELNVGTVSVPDWQEIGNLSKWSHKPTATDAKTTTFDDAGRETHMKANRGDAFTFTGLALEDPDDGVRDAGQVAAEAWAALVGPTSVKQFRITTPGANTLTFLATSTCTLGGGGNDDSTDWELEIMVTGPVDSSSMPDLPGAPTAADATTGNDLITGTWTEGTGSGISMYEIQVYEDAGDTVVLTMQTSHKPFLAGGLANATAYYFKVRARNTAGWGPYSTVSDTVTTT